MTTSTYGTGVYRIIVADTWANLADAVNVFAADGWFISGITSSQTVSGELTCVAILVNQRATGPTLR